MSKSAKGKGRALINAAKLLKREWGEVRKDFRGHRYLVIARAKKVADGFEKDQVAWKRFLKRYKDDVRDNRVDGERMTALLMSFIDGGTSESARKRHWKWARAADFLHDFRGVSYDDIPSAIGEAGGIEAVVKIAAKEHPRRAGGASTRNIAVNDVWDPPSVMPKANEKARNSRLKSTESGSDPRDDGVTPQMDRRKVFLKIEMKPEAWEALLSFPAGARVALYGKRLVPGGAGVQVSQVRERAKRN